MIFYYIDEEPVVRLELRSTNGEWFGFHAYVDSGAFYSVFHADYHKVLGLKLENGRKIFLTVGNGAQIPAYIHKIAVKFAGKTFIGEIAFSPSLGVGTNLLGLASFFEKFSICFHHAKRYVEVKTL